jgi:hypothetical protein
VKYLLIAFVLVCALGCSSPEITASSPEITASSPDIYCDAYVVASLGGGMYVGDCEEIDRPCYTSISEAFAEPAKEVICLMPGWYANESVFLLDQLFRCEPVNWVPKRPLP